MTGRCAECDAPLADDQRYCVKCGARRVQPQAADVAPDASASPAASPTPAAGPTPATGRTHASPRTLTIRIFGRTGLIRLPDTRTSAVLLTGVLGAGVLIGVAIGPVAIGSSAAAAARQIVAVITGQPQPETVASVSPTDTGSTSGGSTSANTSSASSSSSSAGPASAGNTSAGPASAGNSSAGPASAGNTSAGSTSTSTTTTTTRTTTSPTATMITRTIPPKLTMAGVVVSVDTAALSFALADKRGRLYEVHADGIQTVGAKLRLATTRLANGTLHATRVVEVKGPPSTSATVEGVVSFADPANDRYALSVRGVSLLISVTAGAVAAGSTTTTTPATTNPSTTAPAGAAQNLPTVGRYLKVELTLPTATAASLIDPTPSEVKRTDAGAASPPLELAGVISKLDPEAHRITISADSPGLSTAVIVLSVPKSIAVSNFLVTEAIVAHATVAADGTYTLTGAYNDSSATVANDPLSAFGDFKSVKHSTRGRSSRARRARHRRH